MHHPMWPALTDWLVANHVAPRGPVAYGPPGAEEIAWNMLKAFDVQSKEKCEFCGDPAVTARGERFAHCGESCRRDLESREL